MTDLNIDPGDPFDARLVALAKFSEKIPAALEQIRLEAANELNGLVSDLHQVAEGFNDEPLIRFVDNLAAVLQAELDSLKSGGLAPELRPVTATKPSAPSLEDVFDR